MNEIFAQLYWREPLWMLLAAFPLMLIAWKTTQQKHSLQQYADAELLPWVIVPCQQKNLRWQNLWKFLIWLLFAIAAAGPRLLTSLPNELLPQGAAIIVVDHSRSMLANDMFPSRLQLANNMVTQWSQQQNNLKLGLVIFAGASHIVLPATTDKHTLHETAQLLNQIQLPTYGSAFTESLIQAKHLLKNISGERTIIMLTDGDILDDEFIELKNLVIELQQEKISLRILGVGSPAAIALSDTTGHWLQYNGKAAVTRLKEAELQLLAENDNIYYERLKPDIHNQLSNVWQPEDVRLAAQDQHRAIWKELYSWPLLAAMLIIILKQIPMPNRHIPPQLLLFFMAITLLLMIKAQTVYATTQNTNSHVSTHSKNKSEILKQAYHFWQKNNYASATKLYAQVEGYEARMGEGASCFRDQQIDCAITSFSRAAWEANNDVQRGRAAFNLANSFFKQGDFKSAIILYKDALSYQPQQSSYKYNLKFSIEVQHNIERHLRLLARRNARLQNGDGEKESSIDFEDERISTMDDISSGKPGAKSIDVGKSINLSDEQLALYMQRSQLFAQLSTTSIKTVQQQHDWSRFSNDDPVAANKIEFWQRLFELEENIPAHPTSPKIIKGVRPW